MTDTDDGVAGDGTQQNGGTEIRDGNGHSEDGGGRRLGLPVFVGLVTAAIIGVALSCVLSRSSAASGSPAETAEAIFTEFENALRPRSQVITVLRIMVKKTRERSTVTATMDDVVATVEKTERTSVLWDDLGLDDTVTRIRIPGNHVRYRVDVPPLTSDILRYDEKTEIMTLALPAYRIDENGVETPTDSDGVEVETEDGWSPLGRSAQLSEDARDVLREAVLETVREPGMAEMVRLVVVVELKTFYLPVQNSLKPGIELQFDFRDASEKEE